MLRSKKFFRVVLGLCVIGLSSSTLAVGKGDWLIRFGGASVNPNDDSGQVGNIAGSGVAVSDGQALFINATYMIKDNIGLELLAATPFSHDISGTGSIAALGKIAEVKDVGKMKNARFCVVDGKELLFMVMDDEEVHPTYDIGVWVNSPFFATALDGLFESSWKQLK